MSIAENTSKDNTAIAEQAQEKELENSSVESTSDDARVLESAQNLGDVFEMELPPVTQEQGDYIDDDPEPAETEEKTAPYEGDNAARENYVPDVEQYRGVLDEKGNAFDPALHMFPPEKTAQGRWRRIPKSEREKRIETGTTNEGQVAPESNAANRLEAQKMAQIYAGLHVPVFGVENTRPDKDQYLQLVDAIEIYYNENGAIELPPSIGLLMAAGSYTQEIATRESNIQTTKNLFASAWQKIKSTLFPPKDKTAQAAKKAAEEKAVKKEG